MLIGMTINSAIRRAVQTAVETSEVIRWEENGKLQSRVVFSTVGRDAIQQELRSPSGPDALVAAAKMEFRIRLADACEKQASLSEGESRVVSGRLLACLELPNFIRSERPSKPYVMLPDGTLIPVN